MAGRDYTEQLNSAVESMLLEYTLPRFERYWHLTEDMRNGLHVVRFYAHAEPSYGNVAILTDSVIVDIEGQDSDNSGGIVIQRLRAISRAMFYEGPVATVPGSQGAKLVVLTHEFGDVGLHWIAKTDQEERYLLQFGKMLVESISNNPN